jgi:hypothetical protein
MTSCGKKMAFLGVAAVGDSNRRRSKPGTEDICAFVDGID